MVTESLEKQIRIGVLALQGAFREHILIFNMLPNVTAVEVRSKEELDSVDALVLPGGESTAISLIAERNELFPHLREFVKSKPAWGTCAGMILLSDEANRVKKGGQELIGGLHITVNRNQFGGQVESFQANIKIPALEKIDPENKPFDCFFIRAPVVVSINDPSVEVLATVKVQSKPHKNGEDKGFELGDELVVAIQQKHLLATSFHPELTKDHRWHQYFVHLIRTQSA